MKFAPWSFLITIACLAYASSSNRSAIAANPERIHVYSYDRPGFGNSDVLMASLSGVVARTSAEVFMAIDGSNPNHDPEFWLNRFLENETGISVDWSNKTNIPWFIDRYKDKLSGYVVYNSASINEATSVAGALGAVMVHESLLPGSVGGSLLAAGLPQVEDVRGRDSSWVFNNYGHLLNKEMIFRQNPSFGQQLRSLAVLNAGMVFDNTGSTRDTFLAAQSDHSLVYGWGFGGSEMEFFGSASANNLMGVPTDHLHGSAAPARWEVEIPQQAAHTPLDTPTDANKHYVAFVMSDGDNVQWLTNDFARSTRWFGSTFRGDFDFTFDLGPSLKEVNPVALKYFYDQAAADEHKTFFVTPGGEGLNYPSQTPDIAGFMDATVAAMQAVDHNIISVLDDAGFNLDKLNQMVARPEVLGLMLKAGPAYAGHNGAIYWNDGKPIVSVKHTLWDGFDTPNDILAALNSAPRDPLNNQGSYTIVNVHPWSTSTAGGGTGNPMTNVNSIVQNLNSGVAVVTLEELMIHLRNNFGDSVGDPGGPLPVQNLINNGGFEVPDPGNPSRPRDWFYAAAPGATEHLSGQNSTNQGDRAVAINQPNADWRLIEFDVEPGEQLAFSIDFKFIGVPRGSGFRADARFFDSQGGFVGETVQFLDAADYAADEWHTFSTSAVVPTGAPVGDVRLSTYFGPFAEGQILLDNIRLLRNAPLVGDYNGDDRVDAADYTVWRDSLGKVTSPYAGADGDGDGVVTTADYDFWKAAFGQNHAGAAASRQSVPEPATAVASLLLGIALTCYRQRCRARADMW